ncbi:MAG: hypothetical protein Q7W45_15280 [Bacteroidota bacterium]|nr:hypothetical protein [Bacteroidota bacterium]MDP3147271.1 hypothetical protein [Bacteroidota bacterium]MDP3557355.1 hypothetical protein [Bacteroidota bacterium]
MRNTLFFVFISCLVLSSFSQSDSLKKKTSQLYFSWGYTKAAYSKSSIHFTNSSGEPYVTDGPIKNYDFTIYDVTASDKPDFDKLKDVVNITVPQFVFRIGYSFNSKWGIELNFDHTKYVVNDFQTARVKGQINGYAVDGDSVLNPQTFVHFEHTDGANFWMLNAVRTWEFYKPSKHFALSYVLKPGAGVVRPRTDVTLFGENLNNDWHIAGWIVGVESGLRMEFLRNGFFEIVGKGSYANYRKSLVLGSGNGNASHKFFTGQLTLTAGLRFDFKK